MRVVIEMNPTTFWTKYSGVAHGSYSTQEEYEQGYRGYINCFLVRIDSGIEKNQIIVTKYASNKL